MAEAQKGKYTFFVSRDATKTEIKKQAQELFEVDVVSIKTLNIKGISKKSVRGIKTKTNSRKKAIIEVKEGQTIDLFQDKKEKKGKTKK